MPDRSLSSNGRQAPGSLRAALTTRQDLHRKSGGTITRLRIRSGRLAILSVMGLLGTYVGPRPMEGQIFDEPETQETNLVVWVQQGAAEDLEDGSASSMYMRLFSCGAACRVMRLDEEESATSMIIRLQIDGGMFGTFSFVDHGRKQINVLPFIDVAIGDAMVRAGGLEEYPSIVILPKLNLTKSWEQGEAVLDCGVALSDLGSEASQEALYVTMASNPLALDPVLLANCFELEFESVSGARLTKTGKTRTLTVYDLSTWNPKNQPKLQLEAEEYSFTNNYETDMLPGMGMMSAEQLKQMPV